MSEIEALRRTFQPKRIATLFVGESAPIGGSFFYKSDSQFYRFVKDALGGGESFLLDFKAAGFFLDDLVLDPCNDRTPGERKQLHRKWIPSLAMRIGQYRPLAVVSMMKAIRSAVDEAISKSDIAAVPHYNVPFPGNGQQAKFKKELQAILSELPRSSPAI